MDAAGEVVYTCTPCGVTRTEALPPHVHAYTDVKTLPPTCTDQGCTLHTCTACGHSYTDAHTDPLGHQWEGLDCGRCEALRVNPFQDVAVGKWYFEPVMWALEREITTGTSATAFSPEDSCTRGQVVTFLWRSAGRPQPASAGNPFTDVETDDYCYTAVLWAVEQDITKGTSATTFEPDKTCSRGEVATFLYRYSGAKPVQTENPFTDVAQGKFYYDAVLWAVANDITTGTDPGLFAPREECTRGQIVTFLYRCMG